MEHTKTQSIKFVNNVQLDADNANSILIPRELTANLVMHLSSSLIKPTVLIHVQQNRMETLSIKSVVLVQSNALSAQDL